MLTRALVEYWLVGPGGRARDHASRAGLAITYAGANADLNATLWDGLKLEGITPSNPLAVADADMARVSSDGEDRFKLGCLIYLLERVLAFYRTRPNASILNNRMDFKGLADGLASEIARLRLEYAALGSSGGIQGGEILTGTNIPDAICIPYRA